MAVEIQCTRVEGAFAPFGTAKAVHTHRSSLHLLLRDEDGVLAQGEASPLDGYSQDSVREAEAAVGTLRWEAFSEGVPWFDAIIEGTGSFRAPDESKVSRPQSASPAARSRRVALMFADWLDACVAEILPPDRVLPPSLRMALDTLFMDWAGQRLYRSLPQLWAVTPQARRQLCAVVDASDSDRALARISRLQEAGVRDFKLKLGQDGALDAELSTACAIRAAFPDVSLRADGNQRLGTELFSRLRDGLPDVTLDFLEEPACLDRADLETPLARARDAGLVWALDETLQGPLAEAAMDAVAKVYDGMLGPCGPVAVIKATAVGGLARATRLAAAAMDRRLRVVFSHTLDGPIAMMASAALSLALGSEGTAQGLYPHAALSVWPPTPLPGFAAASLHPFNGPGLALPPLLGFSHPSAPVTELSSLRPLGALR